MRRIPTCAALTSLTLGLFVMGPIPAEAYPRPGRTERISVTSSGAEGTSGAAVPSLSDDTRYVAFETLDALVSGDTNEKVDVYVRDRLTGVTELVSTRDDGTLGNGHSGSAKISGNGRYVAFLTEATNLVQAATENPDLVIKDRETGALELVSVAADGTPADGAHPLNDLSSDGRYVLFVSSSDALVAGDTNGTYDVFLRDRSTGLTERVSLHDDDSEIFGGGQEATMTDDARLVAFTAIVTSPPLEETDASDQIQLFVRDRIAGTTSPVSTGLDGNRGNGHSHAPRISRDGSTVAFSSNASNLVPADANRVSDVFVRDLATGRIQRVSVDPSGREANGPSTSPEITGDGRFVAWQSTASNLVPDDSVRCILRNPPPEIPAPGARYSCRDVFLHDTLTGITELVSTGEAGAGEGPSTIGAISADGSEVAFVTAAANLVSSDTNAASDVFVRHRGPAMGIGGATTTPSPGGDSVVSGWATYSGSNLLRSVDAPADTIGVSAAGTEIIAARLVYRHEDRSLLAVISLAELPTTAPPGAFAGGFLCPFIYGCPPGVTPPPVVHGITFEAAGASWYLSTSPSAEYPPDPDDPVELGFTLHRCPGPNVCYPAAQVRGGLGTAGREIRISAPPNVIGLGPGDRLTGVRAFVGVGEPTPGFQDLDTLELGTTTIPEASVELGVAGAGGAERVGRATLSGPRFEGRVADASLPASDRRVWARACIDASCGPWNRAGSAAA